jgi:hypothetical protein
VLVSAYKDCLHDFEGHKKHKKTRKTQARKTITRFSFCAFLCFSWPMTPMPHFGHINRGLVSQNKTKTRRRRGNSARRNGAETYVQRTGRE